MDKKITWLQQMRQDRLDSVWYGGDIVRIDIDHYTACITAVGDVYLNIKGERYKDKNNNGCMAEYLEECGITNDKELREATEKGDVEWLDGNWFEIVAYDNNKEDYIGNSFDCVLDNGINPDDDFEWAMQWIKDNE